ncbi:MAG TPA: signal peptidase I [Gammaproteobacteria bacterium]|nr:signal peptidase I [Gammaproteobacteria bacterium]
MHFDFEFLLVIMTAVSGSLWLLDVLLFSRFRKKQALSRVKKEPLLIEYSRAFFPVLLAVLVLRGFIVEPFRIPSGSMMPTLLVGDFILVNKFSFGLKLPVTHYKITSGDKPKRGDVVVFRYPQDESQDYIKRVIGLPGDHVSYYNRKLSINGEALPIELDHVYQGLGDLNQMQQASGCDRAGASCQAFTESNDGVDYTVMTNPATTYSINGEVFVPEGHYFVMGDNRDHSNDSRIWGYVPEENLVGKAFMIWMHWDWREDGSGLDLSRVGQKISQ